MQNRIYLTARLVRRRFRRWEALLRCRCISFAGSPILFANSFPKSGTHLLTQVLQGFPRVGLAADAGLPAVVTYQGDTGQARTAAAILGDLERLLPGDIAYGHLHALDDVLEWFARPGRAAYFILRDPRDVVVSHVHYVTEMAPRHVHHRYYTEQLQTFDERLRASILGIPGTEIPFPDIAARFAPYLGWLDQPGVLALHYEDFLQNRRAALELILEHAVQHGFSLRLERQAPLDILEAGIDPRRSPTFRSGKAGGWVERFSPENKALFKETAGDLLVRLGYEHDHNW